MDLYERFKEVKTYFDFAFNPKEEERIEEAKLKISLEYFPTGRRKKAKMRRSVAQKYIKHFKQLEMNPELILELMLYNVEIALAFSETKEIKSMAFYSSMLKSFEQAFQFAKDKALIGSFSDRFERVTDRTYELKWVNHQGFENVLDAH